MRPLIVGESHSRDVCLSPDTSSGGRLIDIMGIDEKEYVERFSRMNLCEREWNGDTARRVARVVVLNAIFRVGSTTIVVLGRKVADAFGRALASLSVPSVPKLEFFSAYMFRGDDVVKIVVLPHPSCKWRVWNDAKMVNHARELLIETGVLPKSIPVDQHERGPTHYRITNPRIKR